MLSVVFICCLMSNPTPKANKIKIKDECPNCVGNKFVIAAEFRRLQVLFQENPLDLQLNGFCGLLMGLKY